MYGEFWVHFCCFFLLRAAWWFPKVADLQIYIRTCDIICNQVLNVVVQIGFSSKQREISHSYTINKQRTLCEHTFHL